MDTPSQASVVKVAFIGAGPTSRAHILAFRDVPSVVLVGIYNRSKDKAEKLAAELEIPYVADSVEDLHLHSKADLVVVTVSVLSVASVLKQCMKLPWAIFAEKPPGLDAAESHELLTDASRLKASVYVALNRRSMSSTRHVLSDLAATPDTRYIQVQGQEDSEAAARIHPPQLVSRLMYGNSIHVIDYLRVFGRGEIVDIQVPGRWDPSVKSPVLAWVKFSSGDVGSYIGVWDAPSPWMVSVTTSSRRWEMRPLEKASLQLRGQHTLTPVEPHAWDSLFKPGFRYQAEQVIRVIQGQSGDVVTLQEAVATMDLIHQIYAV